MATNKIREEEVKNKIRQEFFQDYDATPILGDIDFAVTTKDQVGTSYPTKNISYGQKLKQETRKISMHLSCNSSLP